MGIDRGLFDGLDLLFAVIAFLSIALYLDMRVQRDRARKLLANRDAGRAYLERFGEPRKQHPPLIRQTRSRHWRPWDNPTHDLANARDNSPPRL